MRTVPEHLVLNVLARAHPRPLSATMIAWHLNREDHVLPNTTRTVTRTLEALRVQGQVRRVTGDVARERVYGLAPPTCRVCGRDVGAGGTCGRCGEAA